MENEIKELIINTLNIVQVEPSQRLSLPCFILDYSYLERGNVFGDGKCKLSDHYVQIDIYYMQKDAFNQAITQLKNALINKYVYPNIDSYFDTTNKFYRATFQFVVQEREE